MKILLFLLIAFGAMACNNHGPHVEIEKAKAELAQAQLKIKKLTEEESGRITHIVFFNLKADADENSFISEIKKLNEINEVKDLEVGPYKDLGDSRAMNEFDVVMEMSFKDEAAYRNYQAHPIHKNLKNFAKGSLESAPVTYDYTKK